MKALVEQFECPAELALEVLALSRSSYYYQPHLAAESHLEADMQLVAGQFPTYGTRRRTHELHRAPYR